MTLCSSHPHVWHDRQSRLQHSLYIETLSCGAIEIDPHGYPLYDFHVIVRRVLWRQQTENRPGSSTHVRDAAFPSSTVCVNFDLDGLSGPHMLELRFLEIGGHPNVIEGRDFQH